MNLSEKQNSRLDRFATVLLGRFADDSEEQRAHRDAARRFEVFLMGRELAFSEQSFRTYLTDLHQAGKFEAEARAAEQARLRLYFHTFSGELEPDAPPEEPPKEPKDEKPEVPAAPATQPARSAATELDDLPTPGGFTCPACGTAQEEGAECIACGVIFAKWRARDPNAQGGAALGALGAQANRTVGSWREMSGRSSGGGWVVILYIIAPVLALTLYAMVDRTNTAQSTQIVMLEQELTFTETSIREIDEPPTERLVCYLPGPDRGQGRPRAPFFLRAPVHMNLKPGMKPVFNVGLQPRNQWFTDFRAESVVATLNRTWIDKSIGTEGMEQLETKWSAKEVFLKNVDPRGEPRPPFLEPGEEKIVWTYALPVDGVAEEPGLYQLKLTITGWYPDTDLSMLSAFTWRKRTIYCEDALIRVNSFEETEGLRAQLAQTREKLDVQLSDLGTKERISRIGRYLLLLVLFAFAANICYAAFFKPREE